MGSARRLLVTFAVIVAACGDEPTAPTVATGVHVTVATTGVDVDANGYLVAVDAAPGVTVAANGSVSITRLTAGSHTVTLSGVVGNCAVSGENPRSVTIASGETVPVAFAVSCVAVTGSIQVTTATSGVDFDPNGYTVQVDAESPVAIPANGNATVERLGPGNHSVRLDGVAGNCTVGGENPRTLSVTTGGVKRDTARTTFDVVCAPATGTARVITATTGSDLDQSGYVMAVDCYYYCSYYYHVEQMSVNDTVTLSGVPTGPHTFELQDVAVNCDVGAGNPRTVHVAGGTTTDIVFNVTCVALGGMQVTTTTTGTDFDANGYRITLDGARLDATRDVDVNGTATISGLPAGTYSVSLGGVSLNCDVTSPSTVTVTVPGGGTAAVSFSAACGASIELAFTMATNASYEIHKVRSNGGALTSLTSNAFYEDAPVWSPDGSKIAFVSNRDGNYEIYVMNADGSGQTRLTNHPAADYRPAWSPDGSKIAFVSGRIGNDEIYVMDALGANPVNLTANGATDFDPAWSPDGTKIAFVRGACDSYGCRGNIYTMNPDGSSVTQLSSGGQDTRPAWSPDGARLAFARFVRFDYYYYAERDLFVMNANGSGVAERTSGPDDDADPAWSPDGRWIAFNAAGSPWTIRAVRSDGTELRDVVGPTAYHPAWRP